MGVGRTVVSWGPEGGTRECAIGLLGIVTHAHMLPSESRVRLKDRPMGITGAETRGGGVGYIVPECAHRSCARQLPYQRGFFFQPSILLCPNKHESEQVVNG